MLFNTLAFAKFFAFVLVVSWLLVERRWALGLPWAALAGYALFADSSPPALGVAVALLPVTLALVHFAPGDPADPAGGSAGPRPRALWALAAVTLHLGALTALSLARFDRDPVTAGLEALGLPLSAWLSAASDATSSDAVLGGAAAWASGAPLLTAGALLLYGLVRARKVRLLFVLLASYVFYAHWDVRFLPLIWGSSTIDWWLGHRIHRASDERARRAWLTVTVIVNLGVLATFKYLGFGVESARAALAAFGVEVPPLTLEVALPVGISFFTFESMSYVIDVYRRDLEPQQSYVEYLSFVAFFPHLVAGPIVRPRDLLPQLAGPARWNAAEGSEGLFLIAAGLLKKVAIGDYLAVSLVNRVFDAPELYSSVECYAALVGFAVQIYCDFSGYTDIAIGAALLLGVRMPMNFDAPYTAVDIQDFWRRWHISLSTWLRDYLYIPLGGNRLGTARTYVNLLLTMLLGGLWHGASWNFVIWGALHGVALAGTRAFHEWRRHRRTTSDRAARAAEVDAASLKAMDQGAADQGAAASRATDQGAAGRRRTAPGLTLGGRALSVVLTFHLVLLSWVFFRAETLSDAALFLTQLSRGSAHAANLHTPLLVVLAVGLASHYLPARWYACLQRAFTTAPWPAQALALVAVAFALQQLATADEVPFVYFQF